MKGNIKKILKYTISLAGAVVLLYFSFRGVKWADFLEELKICRWAWIAVAMAAGIFSFWLRGVRWRQLLLPVDPETSRRTAFNAVNIGYIANFVLPRIGEFVRCGVISRRSAAEAAKCQEAGKDRPVATYDKVLGTVALERSWDIISLVIVLVLLLVFGWNRFGSFFVDNIWASASERMNFSLWWIVAAAAVVLAGLVWIIVAFRDRSKICNKICSFFGGIVQGFGSCMKMPDKWKFFLHTAFIWVMYWIMSISVMRAVPAADGLNIVDALFLMVAGSLGWVVPVPGGFGAFHFIVALALSTIYGIPFETGIIFATLSHESQAITMVVCGAASYVDELRK